MNVIFLHIPKTAGQSVHAFLEGFFPANEVCPARENFQLLPLSIARLKQYRLFSGHLDWSLLDAVNGPRFVFTILREPAERILSFYFFLRNKASKFDAAALKLPEHQGMHAAITMTPDEYFCAGPGLLRNFIDNHYDNFYSYYFAGRTFDSRNKLRGLTKRAHAPLTEDALVQLAIDNLKYLDAVYTTDSLDKLEADIQRVLGQDRKGKGLTDLRVNVGKGDFGSRQSELRELGASQRTFDRIREMTRMDEKIWSAFS